MTSRFFCLLALISTTTLAQQVTLPLPRLLTVMPMGGQAGQSVEVTITGDNSEDVTELTFSTPKITAKEASERRRFVLLMPNYTTSEASCQVEASKTSQGETTRSSSLSHPGPVLAGWGGLPWPWP